MNMLDAHPLARAGTTTIVWVSLLHLLQGGMLFAWPQAGGATPLLALTAVLRAMALRDAHQLMGSLLLASSLLAVAGALGRVGRLRIWLFIPQHFLLGVMAAGGIRAAMLGRYLDGTVIPWQHIGADQAPMMALFLAHSASIVRRCWDVW